MVSYSEIIRENINCNMCGAGEYKKYDSQDGWHIVKCTSCGHYYLNPRPLLSELPKIYDAEYFADETFGGLNDILTNTSDVPKPSVSFGRVAEIEHFLNERGSALELGPGRGDLMSNLRDLGWDVEGIEISEDATNFAKNVWGLNVFCGTIDDYKTEKRFDVIYMFQVMEHVPYPIEVIKKCHSLLKKGGILLIEVPNLECTEMRYNEGRKRDNYQLPRHLSHFKPPVLKKALLENGFDVLRVYRCPDKHVIDFLKARNKKATEANAQNSAVSTPATEAPKKAVPMLRVPENFKTKIIDFTSDIFPGWRFTIVGRKL